MTPLGRSDIVIGQPIGEPITWRNNLSFLKGGMAMMDYFTAFGPQIDRLRTDSGTVCAISCCVT